MSVVRQGDIQMAAMLQKYSCVPRPILCKSSELKLIIYCEKPGIWDRSLSTVKSEFVSTSCLPRPQGNNGKQLSSSPDGILTLIFQKLHLPATQTHQLPSASLKYR